MPDARATGGWCSFCDCWVSDHTTARHLADAATPSPPCPSATDEHPTPDPLGPDQTGFGAS